MKIPKKYYCLSFLMAVLLSGCATNGIKRTDYSAFPTVKFRLSDEKNKQDKRAQKLVENMADEFTDYVKRFGIHWKDNTKNENEKSTLLIEAESVEISEPDTLGEAASAIATMGAAVLTLLASPNMIGMGCLSCYQYKVYLRISDVEKKKVLGEFTVRSNKYFSGERAIQDLTMQFADYITGRTDIEECNVSPDDAGKVFPGEKPEEKEK